MSHEVVISEKFLEQYEPVLEVIKGCGYQNKLPRQALTRVEKINSLSYSLRDWDKAVMGALTPALFWKTLQKSTVAKHFTGNN